MKRKLEIIFGVLFLIAGVYEIFSMWSTLLIMLLMKSAVMLPFSFISIVQSIMAVVLAVMFFAKAKDKTILTTVSIYFLIKGLFYAVYGTYLAMGKTNLMLDGKTYVIEGVALLAAALVSIVTAGLQIRSVIWKKVNPVITALLMSALIIFRPIIQGNTFKLFDFTVFIAVCIVGFLAQVNICNKSKENNN